MSDINEEVLEYDSRLSVVNEINEGVDMKENMEKPKKPRSAKQIESLKKAQEKLKEKREANKKINTEIPELNIKKIEKNITPINEYTNENSDGDDGDYVKPKRKKKKSKPRIIVEDDSSDSDQEIVISRRRRSKKQPVSLTNEKSKPINIPDIDDQPFMEKEKIKSVEPITQEKQYTKEEILRAYGL